MSTPSNAAPPAWRQFAFFDATPVKDVHSQSSLDIFKSANEISCIAAGQGTVLLADTRGSLFQLSPLFEVTRSWRAHENGRVTHLRFAGSKGIVVSLVEEASTRLPPVLKIWDLRHIDQKTGDPRLLVSQPVSVGPSPHPATVLAFTATLSHVAVGLADGSVLLLRHLDQAVADAKDKSTPAAAIKPKQIFTSADPVTGLGFRSVLDEKQKAVVTLFIVTTAKVLSFPCHGKSAQATVIDDTGAGLHCTTMTNDRILVVARDEAIYTFGSEGREACLAYEGPKSFITAWRSSLIVVSPPYMPTSNALGRRAPASDTSRVGILDLALNVITHSSAFESGVKDVFVEYGDVFVLANDGSLTRLSEKPTHDKLDLLYSRGLYLLAISMAKNEGCDEAEVAEIKRRYGDHLYAKGDYDGAMAQFLQTVGFLQPSYVIRKFLDAQRIHNLLSFLEELHNRKLANSSHTGLLLNCIAKLGDTDRLDVFVSEAGNLKSAEEGEPPFDLETAIRVMRQAGYSGHALKLAKKFEEHESVLSIQLEDLGEWSEALRYVRKLGIDAADDNLRRHGQALLKHAPRETTELLVDLCCGTLTKPEPDDSASIAETPSRGPYLPFLGQGSKAAATTGTAPSISTARPASEADAETVKRVTFQEEATIVQASLPPPRAFFSHFVDQPDQFIIFLETVVERRYGQRLDATGPPSAARTSSSATEDAESEQKAIWNTLLELYLTAGDQSKALKLLQSPAAREPYDPTQALIVCTSANFTAGIVLLYERLGLEEDIVRFWTDRDEGARAIEALHKYGPGRPALYKLVLRYLTNDAARLDKYSRNVTEILDIIERDRILHPIEVTKIFGRTNAASVGLVKDYLQRRIATEKEEIDSDRALIASYRTETSKKEREIAELTDPKAPRVFQVTRCSACGGQLDLPSIHFMCRHSYHQRCLGENEAECPNCARAHSMVREIVKSNQQFADRHDLFLSEVEESDDGWATIASAFSKGLLSRAGPETTT